LYRVKDHGTEDQRRSFIPLFTHLAKLNWGWNFWRDIMGLWRCAFVRSQIWPYHAVH
jgi:hypothetical protein